ncbi:MAG: serine hydrolase domain-containing protein [Terricaulis sp.]
MMMRSKQLLSSAAIMVALASCATTSAPPPAALSGFTAGVQPGCGVALFDGGVQFAAAGYSDLTLRTPIDRNTRFPIGSVTKQFTALVVLQLAEGGALSLDERASRYVPELAGALGDATVRQLLDQTAGVRDHTSLLILTGVEGLGAISREQALALLARQRATNFVPGSRAQYSNGNYLVLSEIAARVTGESFEALTTRLIFRPLGMNDSGFINDGRTRAGGYRPTRDEGYAAAEDMPNGAGPGGIVTTLVDLQRFDSDFRSEARVWTSSIKRQMLTPARLNDGAEAVMPEFASAYGMGVGLGVRNGARYVAHDGGLEGFRAEYIRALDSNVSVAVLCNRADADASEIAFGMFDQALHLNAPQAEEAPSQPGATPPSLASAEVLSSLAGRYRAEELDADFEIVAIDGGLEAMITSPFNAAPVDDTWGGIRVAGEDLRTGPLRIRPVTENGRVTALTLSFGRRAEGVVLTRR